MEYQKQFLVTGDHNLLQDLWKTLLTAYHSQIDCQIE